MVIGKTFLLKNRSYSIGSRWLDLYTLYYLLCHNLFLTLIFLKKKMKKKYIFNMVWSICGHFIIFYHFTYCFCIYNSFKKIKKNLIKQQEILLVGRCIVKLIIRIGFKKWTSKEKEREQWSTFYLKKRREILEDTRRFWKIQENYERVWKRLEPKCARNILISINKLILTCTRESHTEKLIHNVWELA